MQDRDVRPRANGGANVRLSDLPPFFTATEATAVPAPKPILRGPEVRVAHRWCAPRPIQVRGEVVCTIGEHRKGFAPDDARRCFFVCAE
jgi:hypothetical protein